MLKRFLCAGCAVLMLGTLLAGCAPASNASSTSSVSSSSPVADPAMEGWEKYTQTWFDVFDTVTTVIGYAPSEEEWNTQMEAMHADLADYHKLYDIYNHYDGVTNLYDINQNAALAPVKVDQCIMDLLLESKKLHEITEGKMNIAFGSVLRLWHRYRDAGLDDPEHAALPPMEDLQAANLHTSIDDLILDEDAGTVFFADPELKLDVGSVGKGYAVEMVAQAAEERGLSSAILSVGGNIRTIGHKPSGENWTAGIQDPWGSAENAGLPINNSPYIASVYVEDTALVTSGDYQRFYEVDGKRYHHIIDPDTLMPADYFSAVAVLVPDSGLGDCLSTGLFCLSPEEGQKLVESLDGVEAMWMLKDGSIQYSSGFEANIKATLESTK